MAKTKSKKTKASKKAKTYKRKVPGFTRHMPDGSRVRVKSHVRTYRVPAAQRAA